MTVARHTIAPLSDSNHFEICWNAQVLVHYADRISPAFSTSEYLWVAWVWIGRGLA